MALEALALGATACSKDKDDDGKFGSYPAASSPMMATST